jgi:hypothetical protein
MKGKSGRAKPVSDGVAEPFLKNAMPMVGEEVARPMVANAADLPVADVVGGPFLLEELEESTRDEAYLRGVLGEGLKEGSCTKHEEDQEDEETCDEGGCTSELMGFIRSEESVSELEYRCRSDSQHSAEDDRDWECQSMDSVSSAASWTSSIVSMDSMADYDLPEETVIIFDWDDTLCPTTVLTGPLKPEGLSGCKALQDVVREARLTLERARELAGEVVIVTNASEGWMESSCERWMPGLRSTLDKVEFTSARSAWEPKGILTPTGWKEAAFEGIISKFYSRYWRQSWKNVIVIGDADYEHEALERVASLAPQGVTKRCRAKSIRFSPQPTLETLACELQMLRESFENIVRHDDSLDVSYVSQAL